MSHYEASDNVDHGQNDGSQSENAADTGLFVASSDDCADNGDAADCVGAAHERSVKRRRNFGDDFKTDKD